MEIKEITRAELRKEVRTRLETATDKDLQWLYCYYNGFDEWPMITDPVVRSAGMVPGQGVWAGGEEVPF